MFNYTKTQNRNKRSECLLSHICSSPVPILNLHAKVFQAFNLCKLNWEETEQSTGNSFLFECFSIFAFTGWLEKTTRKYLCTILCMCKCVWARKRRVVLRFLCFLFSILIVYTMFYYCRKHIKCGGYVYCSLSCSKRLIQLFAKYFKRFNVLVLTTKQRIQFTISVSEKLRKKNCINTSAL